MLITVNKDSKKTAFEQIFSQITGLINAGTLPVGSRLPSSRELAKKTGVNRTTVIRVYEELWAQGYTESRPGSYTTVRQRQSIISPEKDSNDHTTEVNIFRDHLGLQYDHMMYYLENEKALENDKINFLQLSPDTRLLDKKLMNACLKNTFADTKTDPFNFTQARGYPPLRQEIVKHMKLHHLHADDKNVLVTNGSLQSLQLIFQVFSKPGDCIVIEKPTYSIILLFIKIFQLKIIEVPVNGQGMDMNLLKEALMKNSVRFVYSMPTYHNPTGISMSQKNREELLRLCGEKDCIIIEDSIEEEMNLSGTTYLPLKSIDRRGQVIYLGALTKVMAAGLRMGWIIAAPECIKKLTVLKSIFEISSSTLNQILLYQLFTQGAFEAHLRKSLRIFRKRMRVAVNSIRKYIPAEKIEWVEPNGGYMIWIKLLTVPIKTIETHFSNHGVLIHNGKYFFAREQSFDYIRICIAQTNEAEIEEGIKRIGIAINALEYKGR
ncbi:MAG TPA: PLP-dependent aminotransferase family protein [Bacteroidales bacterium]|nr:PLP-dependent aminotransferase family protein [Bacteroidales bacterium]